MARGQRPWLCISACFLALVPVMGCSPPTCSVSGQVVFDGQPLDDGLIRFRPTDAGSDAAGQAKIQGGGYRIDGIPIGEYRVWIMAQRKTGRKTRSPDSKTGEEPVVEDEVIQIIPVRYNVRSELSATLAEGENEHDFDLSK